MTQRIILPVTPKTDEDTLICRWIDEMNKRYPRYTSMYAKIAVMHYINTGTYITIGSIPSDDYILEKSAYSISLGKDEELSKWIDVLKTKKIPKQRAVMDILYKSIEKRESGKTVKIPSYGELIEIPILPAAIPTIPVSTWGKEEQATLQRENEINTREPLKHSDPLPGETEVNSREKDPQIAISETKISKEQNATKKRSIANAFSSSGTGFMKRNNKS